MTKRKGFIVPEMDKLEKSVDYLILQSKEHTRILTEVTECQKAMNECLIGNYEKQGVVSKVNQHNQWFKWLGGIVTAIILWLLQDVFL